MRWPPPISPRCLLLVVQFVALCSIPAWVRCKRRKHRICSHCLWYKKSDVFDHVKAMAGVWSIRLGGAFSSRLVTLDTVDIFTTHEWFSRPIVFFRCSGDNQTYLPDVKEANLIYTFKGEESWQPLTELPEKKCKRCGLYEEDILKNDVFDEWELCSSDFKDGKYTHFKEGQFNATFLCPNCTVSAGDSAAHHTSSEVDAKKASVAVIIIVSVLASVIVVLALFGGYKYWLKKKRERDQLRFLKLFEEGDDMDDELGLSNEL